MPVHDSFFKRLLRAFLPDLLRIVLPETARQLDFRHLTFLDKELFTESGRRREADLLARLPLLSDGSQLLLVHVEIEARARARIVGRLREYRRRIAAAYDLDIVSIVVTLRGGDPGVRIKPLPGIASGPGLDSQYVSFGLAGCEAADYLRRPEPLSWALAALMNPGKLSRAELKMACLRRIAAAGLAVKEHDLLVDCVATYLQLKAEEVSEYTTRDTAQENQTMRAMELSWGDRLKAEAHREGMEQGARTVLLHLLEQRFGKLPESARQRIDGIDSVNRLTRLAERALTARTLDDLLRRK